MRKIARAMTAMGSASRSARRRKPPTIRKTPAIRCIYRPSHRSVRASAQRAKAEGSAAWAKPSRSIQARP